MRYIGLLGGEYASDQEQEPSVKVVEAQSKPSALRHDFGKLI